MENLSKTSLREFVSMGDVRRVQILVLLLIVLLGCSCSPSPTISSRLPDSSELPRMPDEYRDKDKRMTDPIGMWVYDAAETQADEDYFGVEVLSLEESQRILKDRKAVQKNDSLSRGEKDK